jgi:CDP-diacylglycerol--glycerol-3-phosphate 3-phosphatidyltransferase
MGMMVSYAKARAEGLGIPCNVGIAERTERLLITLVAAGLTGLGVPYVLAIGLWVLAVLSLVTFGQRVDAVRRGAAGRPASPVPAGDSWRDHDGEPPDDARAGASS